MLPPLLHLFCLELIWFWAIIVSLQAIWTFSLQQHAWTTACILYGVDNTIQRNFRCLAFPITSWKSQCRSDLVPKEKKTKSLLMPELEYLNLPYINHWRIFYLYGKRFNTFKQVSNIWKKNPLSLTFVAKVAILLQFSLSLKMNCEM